MVAKTEAARSGAGVAGDLKRGSGARPQARAQGRASARASARSGARPASGARKAAEAKQRECLSVLEKFAKGFGLKVSSGKLFFAGLRLKSGQCVYRDEPWLVLDRAQPFEDQLELFRKAFEGLRVTSFTDEVKSLLYPDGLGILEHAHDMAASGLEIPVGRESGADGEVADAGGDA
ncbi:MAG: hypothetical protein LBT40_08825 [Deltaproteobacteria bacterium]|nr:hypothetical protein [Deltaproteobacteria bacterium]